MSLENESTVEIEVYEIYSSDLELIAMDGYNQRLLRIGDLTFLQRLSHLFLFFHPLCCILTLCL